MPRWCVGWFPRRAPRYGGRCPACAPPPSGAAARQSPACRAACPPLPPVAPPPLLPGCCLADQWAVVAPVAPEQLQRRGRLLGRGQHGARPDRVLPRGGLPLHRHQQALRVHHDRTLAPRYWLARSIAVAAPLFPPVRTDCVSMAPAVGSASRPATCRTCRRRPASTRSQVPSSRQASNCL